MCALSSPSTLRRSLCDPREEVRALAAGHPQRARAGFRGPRGQQGHGAVRVDLACSKCSFLDSLRSRVELQHRIQGRVPTEELGRISPSAKGEQLKIDRTRTSPFSGTNHGRSLTKLLRPRLYRCAGDGEDQGRRQGEREHCNFELSNSEF